MNQDERALITGLFDRMRTMSGIEKDRDAADLISREMRDNPDAGYLLTQSVLVQDHALAEADRRIKALEAEVAGLKQRGGSTGVAGGVSAGGFLGGARSGTPGGGFGSVPTAGAGRNDRGVAAPATPSQAAQPPQRGGFMGQAMSTAMGVAGGMLLASGISSLFSSSASATEPVSQPTDTAAADQASAANQQPAAEDPALQDAAYDDGADDSWFGDGGDWGGDFDV
ncbi:MAG: DUF2076 domain-containing protein [Hyphomicrobiaceae bacterium]